MRQKKLLVLGSGCAKCGQYTIAAQAALERGMPHELEKVTDLKEIIGFGVMRTPALVVDGAVKVTGRVPSVEEIKEMLG